MNATSAMTFQPFRDQLEAAFVQFAQRPALTYQGETWTYAELDARSRAAAAHLQRQGLRAGERVILYTADKQALLLAHLRRGDSRGRRLVAAQLQIHAQRDALLRCRQRFSAGDRR